MDHFDESAEAMHQLEVMVDNAGLSAVLQALETICYHKADHIDTNWQDRELARAWRRDGGRCAKLAQSLMQDA